MKYICFGYLDVDNWMKKSESEQNAMIDRCCAYDEMLKRDGHWAGGRYQNGKVSITDGPYAETKELLGGLLMLEAEDVNQAIQLISNHPGLQMGSWEIRPAEDLSALIAASEKRRAGAKGD
jgi:hypothetical protein